MSNSFFATVYDCLMTVDPVIKVKKTYQCFEQLNTGKLAFALAEQPETITVPGRPEKPELVNPRNVSKRSMNTLEGRVILAHAIAHIEFNAINLALDAAYRFRGMPESFYYDWIKVAKEEAYHFTLMQDYLQSHGYHYGDFSAHNGLWEMALKTDSNVLERMALVPRVLEARGLDVTPGMIKKLKNVGDKEIVNCLEIIHQEEIGHVAIGSHWFKYCCEQQNLNMKETFLALIKQHMNNAIRGPFDEWSRLQAGFTEEEMSDLKRLETGKTH